MAGLHQIGSFQEGPVIETDDARGELWSRIALTGTPSHARKQFHSATLTPTEIDVLLAYATVRVRQAVEFRKSAEAATQITSPLSYYYAFLNLLRGFFALREDRRAETGHGLTFLTKTTLFDCSAKIVGGTFAEYLTAEGVTVPKGWQITLRECLARIPELGGDYWSVFRELPSVDVVGIEAFMDGEVHLDFSKTAAERFAEEWQSRYPQLAPLCTIESGSRLRLNNNVPDYGQLSRTLTALLQPDLRPRAAPSWYTPRANQGLMLPRAAYYYVAIFILGSIVRYEPELVSELSDPATETAWLVGRLLQAGDRYLAQLLLIWVGGGAPFYI